MLGPETRCGYRGSAICPSLSHLVSVLREIPRLRLASRTDTSYLSTRLRNLLNVLTLITPAPLC